MIERQGQCHRHSAECLVASVVNNNLNNLDEQVQLDYQTESWVRACNRPGDSRAASMARPRAEANDASIQETTTRVGRLEEVFLWQGQALRTQDVSLAGT